VVAVFAPGPGSVSFALAVTPAAVAGGRSAGDLVKAFLPIIGGRGGGKKDMAQGGGTQPEGIPAAIDALRAALTAASG
jgi:alanyl-tRNA synthetase